MQEAQYYLFNLIVTSLLSENIPLPTAEEHFPSSLAPMYCPSPSVICGAMINNTLIYEDELIGIICANMSSEVCPFLSTVINCSSQELITMLVLHC